VLIVVIIKAITVFTYPADNIIDEIARIDLAECFKTGIFVS